MISSEDERWLVENYPGLVLQDNTIVGKLSFSATYNEKANQFLILRDGEVDVLGGIALSCECQIRIVTRDKVTYSALPALYVDEIEIVDSRHFSFDHSACLCSPLQEKEFLFPALNFPKFFEELVLPFLYGQCFYSAYQYWPWKEYAHGATGLLESFTDERTMIDQDTIQDFLAILAIDRHAWPSIREALQRDQIKGHLPCFCLKNDQIRRCHPKALDGIRRLQQQVKEHSIRLPGQIALN
ncbi:MAG: hypothetical protein WA738_20070 [Candidatus Angelobacter sp.]